MQKPYYEKPRFKLFKASCLDVLAELPENYVDMVFADAGRQVSVNQGTLDKSNG